MKNLLSAAALTTALAIGATTTPAIADTSAAPVMDEVLITSDTAASVDHDLLAPAMFLLMVLWAMLGVVAVPV